MPSRAEDDNPKVKEFLTLFPEGRVEDGVVLQMAKCHKGPRIIKTHLQIDLLNHDLLDTCKVCASVLMKKNIASLRRIWTCVCCFFFFFFWSADTLYLFTCFVFYVLQSLYLFIQNCISTPLLLLVKGKRKILIIYRLKNVFMWSIFYFSLFLLVFSLENY